MCDVLDMDAQNDKNSTDEVGQHEVDSLWTLTFSSEFELDEPCAKFKPCYIAELPDEVAEIDSQNFELQRNCFLNT